MNEAERHTFARLLPQRGLAGAFVAAINHLLARATWARERLAPHAERRARLRADGVAVDLTIDGDGLLHAADGDGAPDVELQLPATQIPRLMVGELDQVMRQVRIEGNAELADALGFVFRNLRWDVEEDLSKVVGDIAAHRLMSTANAVRETGARVWRNVGDNVAEYLAEESGLLVGRAEGETHGRLLHALRDDLARLEKRVERLTTKHASNRPTGRS